MVTLILCAAGSGERAHLPENKIFFEIDGLPVLSRSLSAFAPYADEMLVVCRKEDEERILPLLSPYPAARTAEGGNTRAESVYNALKEAKGDVVLVHDAARPYVSAEIIRGCIASVREYGSGVCAVPASDTVLLAPGGEISSQAPRKLCYLAQTPQGFLTDKLRAAYEKAKKAGTLPLYTDDSGLYAAYAEKPRVCAGDRANRKLTYPEDFAPAERVGFGTDTHAFAHGEEIDAGIARLNLNYIKLCGVTVPSDRAIEAHSDGDVPVHALMDALLAAIGEKDIGHFFPDTDPAYAGADSMALLAEVVKKVHGVGFSVKNASVSVLCERPRLAPYIERMRENLRAALGCEAAAVAAGTNEKLGYVGEGKGITAYATVLLKKN